jgi:hypothetical protein
MNASSQVVAIGDSAEVARIGTPYGGPVADFSTSFKQLKDAVRRACARQDGWEERIAAGIRAALEFAAADPAAAHVLTVEARREVVAKGSRHDEVIAYFAGLLGDAAPQERYRVLSDEGLIESISTTVRGHLLARNADRLPDLAPDLAYLTLAPLRLVQPGPSALRLVPQDASA